MKRHNAFIGSAVERIEDERFLRGAGIWAMIQDAATVRDAVRLGRGA